MEAEEAHGVQRAPEGAGRVRLHRQEALQRPGVEQGLHAGGVPQELADAARGAAPVRQHIQEPDALPPPRRQPGPPS